MNKNDTIYTAMRIFPKGTTDTETSIPLYVLCSIYPDSIYTNRRMSKRRMIECFKESCKECISRHKTEFPNLAKGYTAKIYHVPLTSIRSFTKSVPIYYVTIDNENPDSKFYADDVELYNYRKTKKLKCKDNDLVSVR